MVLWLCCEAYTYTPMSNSDNSDHSLRSKGLVDPATPEASKVVNQRKAAAKWTAEEERALVTYLQQHTAGAGDGVNFSKTTFAAASQQLKKDFPHQKGGEKTSSTCHSKWTRVSPLIYAKVISTSDPIL